MIIDCAHYQDGRRLDEGVVSLQEAASRCATGGFVWLGLFEPGEDELAEVRDTFGLHELAVEDALNMHMRPKVENYDQNVQLVILRTARYDDAAEEVEFGEISVFLAPTFAITVRQGVASELRGARQRLEQRPELLAVGSAAALWAILDTVVDSYTPVVAGLERDIDQIEDTVQLGLIVGHPRQWPRSTISVAVFCPTLPRAPVGCFRHCGPSASHTAAFGPQSRRGRRKGMTTKVH